VDSALIQTLVAAAAMAFSSFSVVSNSLRLRRFKVERVGKVSPPADPQPSPSPVHAAGASQ
jgi:hypothetical protein